MKSRLLHSPTASKIFNLRIDRTIDRNTPLGMGSLIAANDYMPKDEAEYLETKRIASVFLRVQTEDLDPSLN